MGRAPRAAAFEARRRAATAAGVRGRAGEAGGARRGAGERGAAGEVRGLGCGVQLDSERGQTGDQVGAGQGPRGRGKRGWRRVLSRMLLAPLRVLVCGCPGRRGASGRGTTAGLPWVGRGRFHHQGVVREGENVVEVNFPLNSWLISTGYSLGASC